MKVAAVIAAGGTGTRMNAGVPKQFLQIAGKPILVLTVERISSLEEVAQIVSSEAEKLQLRPVAMGLEGEVS